MQAPVLVVLDQAAGQQHHLVRLLLDLVRCQSESSVPATPLSASERDEVEFAAAPRRSSRDLERIEELQGH